MKKKLSKEEKNKIEITFYERCKDIFYLLKKNHINDLILNKYEITNNKIYKFYYENDRDNIYWYNQKKVAEQKKDGTIKKGLLTNTNIQLEFIEDFSTISKEIEPSSKTL